MSQKAKNPSGTAWLLACVVLISLTSCAALNAATWQPVSGTPVLWHVQKACSADRKLIQAGFDAWSNALENKLTFKQTRRKGAAQIEIVLGYFPGEVGDCRIWESNGEIYRAQINFMSTYWTRRRNAAFEAWHVPYQAIKLEGILHEIGHALGLGHSEDADSVMNKTATGNNIALSSGDVARARELYGE